ncbi:ABC transporter substrate-binding protein [Sabulicella rubraurantiaca]|uniref:ABC transporter substrate-binding protein n=1 Tax=Sabulicella rubraurantiaca TaxID=2811429 RepID=UPI001A956D80|nr:ABC transporter substrate-binding protein [Sabulicella rubraurantiaca]
MRRLLLAAVAMAAALTTGMPPVMAQPAQNTIRWFSDTEPANLSPYFNSTREGVIFGFHVWDAPLYRNLQTGEYEMHLAESVRVVDDTTIELRIREGIVAHNGDTVDARDVVATVEFALNPASQLTNLGRTRWLSGAELVDDRTVRLRTPAPFGPWQEYLTTLLIIPRASLAGGRDGMGRNPIGTGPYRVTEVSPGQRIVFERFDRYFGGAKGRPEVEKLIFRRVPEANTRVAELLTGGVDWIWRVTPDQARNIQRRRGVTVASGGTVRFHYLQMDAAGRTGTEDNPFRDLRVRRAVNHAIDRAGIIRNLVGEGADLLQTPCHPDQFGCVQEGITRYDYNPARARELLAEAGYPNGFTVNMGGYRERPWAEAIIGNLRAVGITANLQWAQYDAYQRATREGQMRLAYGSWGSTSLFDIANSTSYFFRGSPDDLTRDPEVMALLERGDNTTDPAARREAYAAAIRRITEQAYWAPLWTFPLTYAHNAQLHFTPTADEVPRFYRSRWNR